MVKPRILGQLLAALTLATPYLIVEADVPVSRSIPVSKKTGQEELQAATPQISTQQQAKLLLRMQALENEVRFLRGMIEEQSHVISQLQQRQRDLYMDMDRRFSALSGEQVSVAKPAAQAEQSTKSQASTSTTSLEADPEKERQYIDDAFQLVRQNNFDDAIAKYAKFLQLYPTSDYRVNAHYWLGQLYYVKGKYKPATQQFLAVYEGFPGSAKAHDALLKLGFIARDTGDSALARTRLTQVVEQYPNSDSFEKAKVALSKL
tara:strand:+ start:2332 stop:3117 length:786 start_codon:yes stop_codon:yes gene_type:complete